MKLVTDQNIINQLEGNEQSSYGSVVTDKNLISQLESNEIPSVQSSQKSFGSHIPAAIGSGVMSGLTSIANIPSDIMSLGGSLKSLVNKVNPTMGPVALKGLEAINPISSMMTSENAEATKIPDVDWFKKIGVDNPSTLDKVISKGVEYAPAIAGGVGLIKSLAKEGLPLAGELLGKINPTKQAQNIIDTLGSGKTLEDNAINIAKETQKGYLGSMMQYQKGVNGILEQVGPKNLYKNYAETPRFLEEITDPNSKLKDTLENIKGLKDKVSDFNSNQSFDNANRLQTEMGREASKLYRAGKYDEYNLVKEGREMLNDDFSKSLQQINPNLANQWQELRNFYKTDIVPYHEQKTLNNIVHGEFNSYKDNYERGYRNLLKKSELTLDDINNFVEKGDIHGKGVMTGINPLTKTPEMNVALEDNPKLQDMLAYHQLGGPMKATAKEMAPKLLSLANESKGLVSPKLQDMIDQFKTAQNITKYGKLGISGVVLTELNNKFHIF